MSVPEGVTLPEENEIDPIPPTEQAQIKPIDEEAAPAEQEPEQEEETPPAAQEPEKPEEPQDPRAARLERISSQRADHTADELKTAAASMAGAEPAEPAEQEPVEEPAAPERKLKLKIRGEEVELTESEVIARAQKNDAADDYLREARDLLAEAKRARREPQDPAAPPQAETPVEKVDRLARAVEILQSGGDPVEAKALMAEEVAEQATTAAQSVVASSDYAKMSARFDNDVTSGFEAARSEHEALMSDPISSEVVFSFNAGLQRTLIGKFLSEADEPTQNAFAQAGITAQGISSYSPQDTHALYKDMALKGYPLPPPSLVVKTAAKTIAEKFPGNTQPAPAPTPEPQPQPVLDRSARKDALVQPERTSIPRPTTRTPVPRTEPQRAASARQELKAGRRAGVPVRR